MVNVLTSGEPAAQADGPQPLGEHRRAAGHPAAGETPFGEEAVRPLEQLTASRSERRRRPGRRRAGAGRAARPRLPRPTLEAARSRPAEPRSGGRPRVAAEPRERPRQAAEAEAAAPRPSGGGGRTAGAAVAPSGSYQEYALSKLGGDGSEFSCLESLWGKESGWNPNAQNPTSTAYGIPQFLDSTWAGTGIAKTSDGYRQIDAGLIYIDHRYGSPCGAWAHSQANNWY